MRTRHKLNVKQVAALQRIGVHSDGGGLYLRIRRGGSRSWLFVKVHNGRRREFGLGSTIDVSLAIAREHAAELRRAFLEGREIIHLQRSIEIPTTPTFGQFADEFITSIASGFRNQKHINQWSSTIKTYAAPIADKPISDINERDLLKILQPIWLEKHDTASRVRGRIERILDAAKVKGLREGENPARFRGHLSLLLPSAKKAGSKHHAAMPYAELPAFMTQLRKRQGMAARALEFTILTAARSGETLGMTWKEIDLEAAIWSIPAERMKAGEGHIVPLCDAAIALLTFLRPNQPDGGRKVFHNGKGTGLSNMAMLQLLRRMELHGVTVHGFRSSFRDWAGEETNVEREVIEMALAHQIESKTERAYRRARSLEKRRSLMNLWRSYCY